MSRSHPPRPSAVAASTPRHGLARVLSKLGVCSRSVAGQYIAQGRVTVDGKTVRDAECPTDPQRQRIALDGQMVAAVAKVYIALNKPRGIVVSAADERGRGTVYDLLDGAGLPWLGPAGRLDKASEGLLLLSNDTQWAAGITEPAMHLDKTYHVQVAGLPDAAVIAAMLEGVEEGGERLRARRVEMLRSGEKNAWLEIVLDEGRNRHIRRLLAALDFDVLRLIRVAIGPLALGQLGKGQWRMLDPAEILGLSGKS